MPVEILTNTFAAAAGSLAFLLNPAPARLTTRSSSACALFLIFNPNLHLP